MKRVAGVVLLGVALLDSASAAEQSATAKPALSKEQGKATVAQSVKSTARKTRMSHHKPKSAANSAAEKANSKATPAVNMKQGSVTENPADPVEQSVQLKGVRG